ncbi:MAG: hypothetical protein JST83_17430 [Bacteroidetes bacterium]|nr:hypothetical protein [Bacteroidota bacterium]
MKRFLLLSLILITGLALSTDAAARGWHRYYAPRPYCVPVRPMPVPAPYYRPYYAAPVYRDIWVQPHWRYTPYGREWVPGHYIRQRVY